MKLHRCHLSFFVGLAWFAAATSRAAVAPPEPKFATATAVSNQPMGQAKGIFPGLVVWVHNASAVNQNCVVDAPGHGWYLDENHNQTAVDAMVATALHDLTGQTTDHAAWTAIFRYHNTMRGKGAVDYARGEKIFIKINATSAWAGNFDPADLTPGAYISETSIASVRAMLRQLVNVVGVDPRDIYVGDPLKHIYKHLYDAWHGEFPDVHFLDNGGFTNLGRENVVPSSTAVIHYSDRGTVLKTNVWANNYPGDSPVTTDTLYSIFKDAEYLINIPMLKGHRRAGMTMFAKNHFGSQTRLDASHLHNGLVAPTETQSDSHSGYGIYRVQVDIMGHSLLGKKNLLYLMDALWATDYELDVPLKWQMPPFSNSYMASVFASLDPVAIESVGYDFLRSEFTAERVPAAGTYVQMNGADDYLRQAADSANWPAGIRYDPDDTGTPIASLGAYEHWNNAIARQYSRNLSVNGTGIELVAEEQTFRVNSLASHTIMRGDGATFTAVAAGTPPLTFRWQRRTAAAPAWSNLTDDAIFAGASTSALTVSGAAAAMNGDELRCIVTDAAGSSSSTNAATLTVGEPGAGRLVNIATRAYCGNGDNVAIGGFVITGAPKRVLVRAVGPTLTTQGIALSDVLRDPQINLHDALHGNAVIATNDDWSDNTNAAEVVATAAAVGATALADSDRPTSALLLTLPPGVYSFFASGKSGGAGIVLVEVYDADPADGGGGRLVNIATRAACRTGDNVTIGGFVIAGSAKRVLLRAVGPTLTTQGIAAADVLRDPVIEVHDVRQSNAVIATNDNWTDNPNAAAITAAARTVGATAFAIGDTTSSALLLTLGPGVYTFVASGKSGTSGIVLVEVYDVE